MDGIPAFFVPKTGNFLYFYPFLSPYAMDSAFIRRFSTRSCLLLLLFSGGILLSGSMASCSSQKKGCPVNEDATKGTTGKNGELSTKRGKSNLFPKKMR